MVVGDAGLGIFNQSGGTITVQGSTNLGNQATGNGTYNLSGSGRLSTNQDLTVGNYGTGIFNQSGGTNTVTGTLRIAKESGSAGTYNLSGGSLSASSVVNNGIFNLSGGTASVNTLTGTGATTVGSGRTLTVNQLRQGSLTVNGAVTLNANGGASGTVMVNSLSVGASGSLDLKDNDLVVDSGSFTSVQSLVYSGYRASSDPTATGIVSTTSQNLVGVTILALFDNSLVGTGDWPPGSGNTVAANAVIGKYTYFGDVNMDGMVTGDDLAIIDANLNTTPNPGIAWLSGDANLDGSVTGDDKAVIDANLGLGAGNPLAPNAVAVPEPTAFGLGFFALAAISRRRRRSAGGHLCDLAAVEHRHFRPRELLM